MSEPKFATKMSPEFSPPSIEAYYDATKKEFVMRNSAGRWLSHPAQQFKMLLAVNGHHGAEKIMANLIDTRDVAYVGSLAGHKAGFYDANGVRMLVTEGPRILTPKLGKWPTINRLLRGLIGSDDDHGERQFLTFLLWMQSAFQSISTGKWRPAHVLALVGPIQSGKSLLMALTTEAIGGRSADCFRYLSGASNFNKDLFAAEHLMIDDKQASTDFRTRLSIAAHLKEIAVCQTHSCHGKNRDAVNLRPLWRCSLSLNDEGECVLVLPPLRADIADKIHLLKCSPPAEPFPTETPEAQDRYFRTLVGELPAFLHHCLSISTPAEMVNARFGFRAFHHPSIVLALEEQAPEIVLLELIDLELWRNASVSEWEGTARDLESALLAQDSKVRDQTRRLLTWNHAAGTYLGRLSKSQPDRIEQDRTEARRGWIIHKNGHNCASR